MENFWKNKKVFITGGNGFLGSHLTSLLLSYGAKPIVLVYEEPENSIFEQRNLARQALCVYGDIRNFDLMRRVIDEYKIDTVFHLAAQAIVDHAIEKPVHTFETNIQGTWNILEACRRRPHVERIIVASSDKAYGDHDSLPYNEDTHHLKGGFPYEVSKTCTDLITQSYHKTYGSPVTITRCTNFYGPGDLNLNRLIPNTIRRLLNDDAPVIRDTGESLRDYLYVEDVADGYRLLAEKMEPSLHGEVFNFSVNKPLSVSDAIAVIMAEMKKNIEPVIVNTRGLEIRHQFSSYDKAKKHLGWQPKHSFAEGVRKTIPWYTEYLKNVGGLIQKELVLSK